MKRNLKHTETQVQVYTVDQCGKGAVHSTVIVSITILRMEQQFSHFIYSEVKVCADVRGAMYYPMNWCCSWFPTDNDCSFSSVNREFHGIF